MTQNAGTPTRPLLSKLNIETTNASPATTSEVITDSVTFAAIEGETYRATHDAAWAQSASTAITLLRIREDNATGTQLQGYRLPAPGTTAAVVGHIEAWYTADATEDKTIVVTALVSSGSVTRQGSATQPSNLEVRQQW